MAIDVSQDCWQEEEDVEPNECNTLSFTLRSVFIFVTKRYQNYHPTLLATICLVYAIFIAAIIFIRNIHLKCAATRGGAAGGVGAEEDEVGQQNRHLGKHMDDFYIGRMGDHV